MNEIREGRTESAVDTGIAWQASLDAAREAAKRQDKLLLTYFWAPG